MLGFAGPTSSMHYVMRMEEKFTDSQARRQRTAQGNVAAQEAIALQRRPTTPTAPKVAAIRDRKPRRTTESPRQPTIAPAAPTSPSRSANRPLRQAAAATASQRSYALGRALPLRARARRRARRAAISSPAAPAARCEPPTITIRSPFFGAAHAAGPVVGVLDQLLHVGRRRAAERRHAPVQAHLPQRLFALRSRRSSARSCAAATAPSAVRPEWLATTTSFASSS